MLVYCHDSLHFCLSFQFTAMIRLPELMPKKEKMNRMDKLIDDLDLRGCLDTSKFFLSIISLI